MTDYSSSTGLVLGKFMPPHAGHMHLIDFARHYVSRLAIVMDSLPTQPIAADLRLGWLRELFPGVEIFHLTDMPQAPEEHPDFWAIWQRTLRTTLPFAPDFVFAWKRTVSRLPKYSAPSSSLSIAVAALYPSAAQ